MTTIFRSDFDKVELDQLIWPVINHTSHAKMPAKNRICVNIFSEHSLALAEYHSVFEGS